MKRQLFSVALIKKDMLTYYTCICIPLRWHLTNGMYS